MRLTSFIVLCSLSLGVAAYAVVAYGFLPLGSLVHPDMRTVFETHQLGIYAHVFGSVIALTLGPSQFVSRLRKNHTALHRWLGRLYLGAGVLIGGSSGLYMASMAFGGIVARLGFSCLAVAWLYTGLRAYLAIRGGAVAVHRVWMIRNYALTLAAVTLRLYIPMSGVAGIEFEVAYPYIAWISWVPIEFQSNRTNNTRQIVAGKTIGAVSALAICQSAEIQGFYLLGCDDIWSRVTDTWHQSLKEAQEQAEFEYVGVLST
jgi:uncharacterized membrane protein